MARLMRNRLTKTTILLVVLGGLLLAGAGLTLAGAGADDLPWSTSGSSGNFATSTDHELGSTSGQSVIGFSSGNSNGLCAGFWCGVQCMDDHDGLDTGFELARVPQTNPCDYDTDDDGCWDGVELGGDENFGGLREPTNPWDFYDVLGGGGGPPDQIIDLSNDIFGVIIHYAPTGTEPTYDVQFDRGPQTGANVWNMGPPDGVIDLSNDILGVIQQYLHDCR